jgi:hypothetical protein
MSHHAYLDGELIGSYPSAEWAVAAIKSAQRLRQHEGRSKGDLGNVAATHIATPLPKPTPCPKCGYVSPTSACRFCGTSK